MATGIRTRTVTVEYEDGWDKTFGKKKHIEEPAVVKKESWTCQNANGKVVARFYSLKEVKSHLKRYPRDGEGGVWTSSGLRVDEEDVASTKGDGQEK